MKYTAIIFSGLIFVTAAQAADLSPCQKRCYEAKATCNVNASYTFNSCHKDLFACKASCNSGKKHYDYDKTIPFNIRAHPILKLNK